MLAEHVDHVIGIDPDRDRITAAIVAADTAAVIDTTELTTTADGYRQLVTWADHHSSAESRAWSYRRCRQLRRRRHPMAHPVW